MDPSNLIPRAEDLRHSDISASRKALGIKQETLAELCGIGCRHMKRIEAGHSPLSPTMARLIVKAAHSLSRKKISEASGALTDRLAVRTRKAFVDEALSQKQVLKSTQAATRLANQPRRMFMPALAVTKRDQPRRAQGAINPATGKRLIDLSKAPSKMETQK